MLAAHRRMRTFEVTKAEIHNLSKIDPGNNTFKAILWLEFSVRGAAKDADFMREGSVFPLDESTGKPTFKPSVGWYIDKLEFANAERFTLLDTRTRTDGDDVYIMVRWEGVFRWVHLHSNPVPAPRSHALLTACAPRCSQRGIRVERLPIRLSSADDEPLYELPLNGPTAIGILDRP